MTGRRNQVGRSRSESTYCCCAAAAAAVTVVVAATTAAAARLVSPNTIYSRKCKREVVSPAATRGRPPAKSARVVRVHQSPSGFLHDLILTPEISYDTTFRRICRKFAGQTSQLRYVRDYYSLELHISHVASPLPSAPFSVSFSSSLPPRSLSLSLLSSLTVRCLSV